MNLTDEQKNQFVNDVLRNRAEREAEMQPKSAEPEGDLVERMLHAYDHALPTLIAYPKDRIKAMTAALRVAREEVGEELEELRQWKKEQMQVESEWDAQAVGRELNMSLGSSIRANILPSIKRLKTEIRRLAIEEAISDPVDSYDELESVRSEVVACWKWEPGTNFSLSLVKQMVRDACCIYHDKLRRKVRAKLLPEGDELTNKVVQLIIQRDCVPAGQDESVSLKNKAEKIIAAVDAARKLEGENAK